MAVGAPVANGGTGSVSVFELVGGKWVPYGQVLLGENAGDGFGASIDISADGSFLVVGAPYSGANGKNAGQLRAYQFTDSSWEDNGTYNGPFEESNCGYDVATSDDGSTVAVGCPSFDLSRTGEVYTLTHDSGTQMWDLLGQTLMGNVQGDLYGFALDLSGDGSTLVVGAPSSGISGPTSGRVFAFRIDGMSWELLGQPFDGDDEAFFAGYDVSLSEDGSIVSFGLPGFTSSDSTASVGAIRTLRYRESADEWVSHALDIIGEGANYRVGQTLALSADGSTISYYAGPYFESGQEAGGQVIIRSNDGSEWIPFGPVIKVPTIGTYSVGISGDGNRVLVGHYRMDSPGTVAAFEGSSLEDISPTSAPTLSLEDQNELVTCISILDENTPFRKTQIDQLWDDFRMVYPDRPFCLLQPNQIGRRWTIPSNSQLYRPHSFTDDGNTIFRNVTRDNGNENREVDWYDMCNLSVSKSQGLTRVALFIDDSGSMSLNTVGASLRLFEENLELNGFEIVRGVQNDDEDYITPCMTATTIPS